MSAIVTDQFRILNASNFIDSVLGGSDHYYAFLGLANPSLTLTESTSFGRANDSIWNDALTTPSPTDNFQYRSHYKQTSLFGKKLTSENIRRVVKKHQWTINTRYDMYRHDYGQPLLDNTIYQSPNSSSTRLYDSNYYVVNSDFRVYICIDNGSSGEPGSEDAKGNRSQDEPTFTELEPTAAGTSGDGYIWKYLFTISPSDIIKFDSTEYIVLPNDWETSTDSQILNVRESGDSFVNNNQIKKVYIEKKGTAYKNGTHNNIPILGDGQGGKVSIVVNSSGEITSVKVTSGGSGYTYGMIDLGSYRKENITADFSNSAKLIPIIPPSRGHGYDLYSELGADKVLIYSRFDDSTRDFPTGTKFGQVGILKNPKQYSSNSSNFTGNEYSSLHAIKLTSVNNPNDIVPGEIIEQEHSSGSNKKSKGYVASYDKDTQVLKYFKDRSLFLNNVNKSNETDYQNVSSESLNLPFEATTKTIIGENFTASVDTTFTNSDTSNGINLGVTFVSGLANPEINKNTGDLIYINNRPTVTRDSRQKEDVKIILEF